MHGNNLRMHILSLRQHSSSIRQRMLSGIILIMHGNDLHARMFSPLLLYWLLEIFGWTAVTAGAPQRKTLSIVKRELAGCRRINHKGSTAAQSSCARKLAAVSAL